MMKARARCSGATSYTSRIASGPERAGTAARESASEIIEWLASDECYALDEAGLIAGLGNRIRAGGLPLDCIVLHLRRLHPKIVGSTMAWAPGHPIIFLNIEHDAENLHDSSNPVFHVISTRTWLDLRTDDRRWRLRDVFLRHGLVELVIAPIPHAPMVSPAMDRVGHRTSAVTFGTRRATGFSSVEKRVLARIVPALHGAIELKMWRRTATTLVDTYIGSETGRWILSGHVRRGDVQAVEAALMFCDLHDFTALSNRVPARRVLELLNLYFDQVVPAIMDHHGDILKFMGDGVLAFFHDDGGPSRSCASAFEAALSVHQRLKAISQPDAELRAGIALHFGEVSYGNIGSGERLDFTVIGRDVNLTSRIQGLCRTIGQPLLMSERFAALLALPSAVPIGRYELRGFAEHVELFASPRSAC
jgi:adenylate cyclase